MLFGLFQDCASVLRSKGFKKRVGHVFKGRMRASMLPAFLNEAISFHDDGRPREGAAPLLADPRFLPETERQAGLIVLR